MHSLFDSVIHLLTNFINQIGYLGIFIGMFLESTLVPLPSELIMIPAGISAAQSGMNIYIVTLAGISGNVLGAVFSYYLAILIGRPLLFSLGKFFLIRAETIIKMEKFFQNHGPISVFIGRLLPGFRHFISLPAGIAKMNLKSFFFYTAAGSTIWTSILVALGFFIGANQELIKDYLHQLILACIALCLLLCAAYILLRKKKCGVFDS